MTAAPDFRATVERLVADAGTPDLSLRQLSVLLIMRDEPKAACTIRDMAVRLNVSKPAITRAVTRLQEMRFAIREIDQHDRRSVFACLTKDGRAFARSLPASNGVPA